MRKNVNFRNIGFSGDNIIFDFHFRTVYIPKLKFGFTAEYQVENASLALAAIFILSKRFSFNFSRKPIKQALKNVYFPARMETFKCYGKTIIVDGAHNPQKMAAFTKSLVKMYPKQKFDFLIATKKGKDFSHMLRYIIPLAKNIIATNFFVDNQDLIHLSENPKHLMITAKRMQFHNIQVVYNPHKALSLAFKKSDNFLIVTGSFYLIGEIYQDLKFHKKK